MQLLAPLIALLLSLAPALPGAAQSTKSAKSRSSHSQRLANPLNDLLDEARKDIDKQDFQAAIGPLQRFIEQKPDFAYAHFQLGYAYTALNQKEQALAEYQRAAALDPKMPEAQLNLGILLLADRPAEAVAPLEKAAALLPAESRPLYLLGVARENSGDLSGAEKALESALHLDPKDAPARIRLASVYAHDKRYADAEKNYRFASNADPKSAEALGGLAHSLDAQKKPEAADAYRDYLALRPGDRGARERLLHLLLEQQRYDEARAELDLVSAGRQPDEDVLRMRADIAVAQKQWPQAEAALRQAIALSPRDAGLHGGLGRVYLQARNFPNASNELKLAIQLDPQNAVYWKDLASTFYLAGDYRNALVALDAAAKREQPGAIEWFVRALCNDKMNQAEPALEAYEKFLALDGNKNPDQVWQAQQRSQVLRRMLKRTP
jgi:Flp pilus assembly protein TadD